MYKLLKKLRNSKDHHHWDPNLPYDVVDEMDEALQTSDKETQLGIAHELIENSPYPPIAVSYRVNNTEN